MRFEFNDDSQKICNSADVVNYGIQCDICGNKVLSVSNINGRKYCAGCYYKTFIKDNQQTEIDQLKQQLVEKDKEIKSLIVDYEKRISQEQELMSNLEKELAELKEKDNYHLRYELAGADETITNLKEQLAEKDCRIEELEGQFAYECECNKQLVELQKQLEKKQNEIDEINKEFVQSVKDWKTLCAEKDKEIEKLKQQYTILENENGKLTTELIMDKYKKAQKEVSFGKQLAIQELAEVERLLYESHYKEIDNRYYAEYEDIKNLIDSRIKALEELKGEKE